MNDRDGEGMERSKTVERMIEGPDGKRARVLVNLGESPVAWLHARGMLSRRQFEAVEALRRDWEKAGMSARVTMNWDLGAVPIRAGRGGAPGQAPTLARMSARDRLNGALAVAGPGLADILWRVVCACESLVAAERALQLPARAGKLVLGFALDRVGDYYRIG